MTTKFLGDAAASNVDNPANYDAEEEEFADIAAMVYLGMIRLSSYVETKFG